MLWVDPTDPSVVAAVTGDQVSDPVSGEDAELIATAVAIASEILTLATAYLVHPAGEQTEEVVTSRLRRFSPLYGPVVEVVSVERVSTDGLTATPVTGWRKVGNTIQMLGQSRVASSIPLWRTNGACGPDQELYRVTYRMGSTVTRAARAAMLDYAHELWLAMLGSDECSLPQRTTSVTREGLGIEMLTPQDYLDKGRTGLERVDAWLSQVNPKRALRPAGVYTPDSPPGVGVRLRRV